MAHNRYFAISADDENINEIAKVIVGDFTKQRKSLDGSLIIVKLCEDDHEEHGFLSQYEELTDEQAFSLMQTPQWQNPIQ